MSVRDIGERWEVNRGKFQRAARWMATHLAALEARAVEWLGAACREHAVVSSEDDVEWTVMRAQAAASPALTV